MIFVQFKDGSLGHVDGDRWHHPSEAFERVLNEAQQNVEDIPEQPQLFGSAPDQELASAELMVKEYGGEILNAPQSPSGATLPEGAEW